MSLLIKTIGKSNGISSNLSISLTVITTRSLNTLKHLITSEQSDRSSYYQSYMGCLVDKTFKNIGKK